RGRGRGMSGLARLALLGLVRAPGRTAVRIGSLAAAVALIGAMILFVGHSLRTMTASATRSRQLDWQWPVPSYSAAVRVAAAVARQPGVQQAAPVATAPFASIVHHAAVGTIRSGSGAVLAVPPGYLDHIRSFRFLRGGLRPGEIVFDQQLAATLQVQPGDTVTLSPRPGATPRRFRVSGVALVTAPDVLFQPLNPLVGPAPAQPPADIAILPLATFARALALAFLAALGTVERDRRELALLRARGASRRDLAVLALVESTMIGLLAGALGTAGAILAVRLAGSGSFGTSRLAVAFGLCVVF